MTYFNRIFIFTTLIVLQHVAVGSVLSWLYPTGDNDAKEINPNITEEMKSYRDNIVAEFERTQGEITTDNRKKMLEKFNDSVLADFKNQNSEGFKAAIEIHKKDCADHRNRLCVRGVHDLANLDFKGASNLYPENRYLKELAEIPENSFQGIWLKNQILKKLRVHDEDKLSKDLLIPYAKICRADAARSLFTKEKCNQEELNFNEEIIKKIGAGDAFTNHVETNDHHPEFWIKKGKRMDTCSVFEMFEDGKACASRFESNVLLKDSNEKSRGDRNWGRLKNDNSCWKDLADREEVAEALGALMQKSEEHYGANITVQQAMDIAQEKVKESETILKSWYPYNIIACVLSYLRF